MTASASLKPFSIILSSAGVSNASRGVVGSATLSDSLPMTAFLLSLSRCPSAKDLADLAAARLSCTVSASAPVFAALVTSGSSAEFASPSTVVSLAGACTSGPSLLASVVHVGAYFRAPKSSAELLCSIYASGPTQLDAGDPMAQTSFPLRVLPTRWPLWDDAVLVAASGLMRSARLGVTLNATAALIAAAPDAGGPTVSGTPALPLSEALASPMAVLVAARAVWDDGDLNYTLLLRKAAEVSNAAFSLTLSGSSRVVLFAGPTSRAYATLAAINATLGGVSCNISAVSDDGAWAVLDTPTSSALCGAEETADCGYAALRLTSAAFDEALGASLECPPFCPGAVSGRVVPLAIGSDFALGTDPPNSNGALPALLASAESEASSEGIYYAAACSQTGLSRIRRAAHAQMHRTLRRTAVRTAAAQIVLRVRKGRFAPAASACGLA